MAPCLTQPTTGFSGRTGIAERTRVVIFRRARTQKPHKIGPLQMDCRLQVRGPRRSTLFKRRWHLFEFGDQSWVRGWLREIYNDALNLGQRVGGHYRRMAPVFSRWAERSPSSEVLELASGGGAPLTTMLKAAEEKKLPMPLVICSDLYPDKKRLTRLRQRYGSKRIDYVQSSVSALAVPKKLPRFRCMFSALHHFRPKQAARVIEDAVLRGHGIFILEPFQRDLRHLAVLLAAGPWLYMFTPFFSKSFTFRSFLFCTVFPVVPFMLFWDGLVSVLRIHTVEEIEQMIPPSCRAHVDVASGFSSYRLGCKSMYVALTRRDSHASC